MAEGGFSALGEMRKEVPDVLLSDLNMPGMSGFELLLVVRSRFPAIQTVAMSSLFSDGEVPSSVVADAFIKRAAAWACCLGSCKACNGTIECLSAKRLIWCRSPAGVTATTI
jgi:CheY-like chemotaxis protein